MILCPEVWGRCPTGEFPTFWADAPLLQSSRCSFLPCSREVIGLFSGWWLRTDGVSCLRHWAHKGIKVVWTAQTLRCSWPLWFSYLCISLVSLRFDLSDGRALASRLLALPGETCEHQRSACVFISLPYVCFLHLSVFALQASREQTGRGNTGSMDQLLGGTCFSLMCFQGF